MYISVMSEIDSRMLIYPLMRALWNYGTILVVSTNKQLRRLIDDEVSSTFRNVAILIGEVETVEEIKTEYGIDYTPYDFVIFDNLGFGQSDMYLVALGKMHSPEFEENVNLLLSGDESHKVHVIQYGTPSKKSKVEAKRTTESKDNMEYNPAEKWAAEEAREIVRVNKTFTVKFPTSEWIETLESEHVFEPLGMDFCNAFFDWFGTALNISATQFRREVQGKDENSGNIRSVYANWVE